MNKPLRRLGRGLDSLISRPVEDLPVQSNPPSPAPPTRPIPNSVDTVAGPVQTSLPLDALVPNPFQPRSEANQAEIESLAASIKHSGMLQPISVRFHNGRYEIIAGERRWHAARQCGMAAVPVSIRKATDEQMLELALVENLQRQDLNAIDRARAYQEFCQRFNLPVDELAIRLAEDRSTVANYIRLLDLPRDVQAMVSKGELSMGQARAIVAVRDPAKQLELAKAATSKQLSVRAVEELVRNLQKSDNIRRDGARSGDRATAHVRDLERRFEEALKTRVSIKEGRRKGSGRLVIEYFSIDDFDRIAEALGVALE